MKDDLQNLLSENYELFARKAYRHDHGEKLGNDHYITALCDQLLWLNKTDGGRLVVNMPPRHGKTLFAAIYYGAWLLGRNPRLRIIIVTYSGDLAGQISYNIRRIMRTSWYRAIFPTVLERDRQQAGNFLTDRGGSVYATSLNGVIGGIGADIIILDDALNLRDATDDAKVAAVNRIFDGEITSRLNTPRKGRIVVIAHRLAENDLSAHLKSAPKTRHLVLPLVAVRRTKLHTSAGIWIRGKGELLRAGSHSRAEIERLKLNTVPSFDLFYQQGVGGSIARLTTEHFHTYDGSSLTPGPIVFSVDTAVKSGPENSFTVMQAWAPRNDGFYLIEQIRERCGFAESERLLRRLMKRLRPNVVLIEDRATGTALIDAVKRRTAVPVVSVDPGQHSKIARMNRHVKLIRKRQIFLPQNFLDLSVFVDEILGRGDFTDQMDALSQMLDFVTTNDIPQKTQQPGLMASSRSVRQAAADPNGYLAIRYEGIASAFGSGRRR